ncbi:MAG TPA: hypothetical protein VKU62_01270 [Thermoanaerobaculia bacterium]|nr:hypothetical protein [Thermoanaerobaculia bacterium]
MSEPPFKEDGFRALGGWTDVRVVALPTMDKIKIYFTPSFGGGERCVDMRVGDALTLAELLKRASKTVADFQRNGT